MLCDKAWGGFERTRADNSPRGGELIAFKHVLGNHSRLVLALAAAGANSAQIIGEVFVRLDVIFVRIKAAAANRAPKEMNRNQHDATIETGWPMENRYDRNFSSNDIPKLIARWRFLEADRNYHAATASDPELAKAAWRRHTDEQSKIIQKLEQTVADNFKDASKLLDFAIERLLIFGALTKNTSEIRLLKNVKASVFNVSVQSSIAKILVRHA